MIYKGRGIIVGVWGKMFPVKNRKALIFIQQDF